MELGGVGVSTVAPDYLRQQGFFDPSKNEHAAATFVGCGGIGSFAAFATAKLGVPNITLIDPDVVEAHNLPSQMYLAHQNDEHKVDALAARIVDEVGSPPAMYASKITDKGWVSADPDEDDVPGHLRGVVVSGFDNMKARHDLWHQAVKHNPRVPLYIDARLDGQIIVIYSVNPMNGEAIKSYEGTLFEDSEVPTGLCTARAIIDVGFMVGALIARMVRKYYAGDDANIHDITCVNMDSLHITRGDWS